MTLAGYEFRWLSLAGEAERISCFISYSNRDEALAERLMRDLTRNRIVCWKAPGDLSIGESFEERLVRTVRRCDRLVVLLSGDAIESRWVKLEVETALDAEAKSPGRATRVLPLRVDDAIEERGSGWVDACRSRHIGDFRAWRDDARYRAALESLLSAIRTLGADRRPGPDSLAG
jgi:TIR domain